MAVIFASITGVKHVSGAYLLMFHGRMLVLADTTVNINPNAEQLAEIAIATAETARRFNLEPRVAMDADPQTVIGVLQQMKRNGKGVIGMKIFGQGALRDKPDECLQFALAAGCLDCFTIGSESRAEMEDLVRKIPAASVRG